MKTPKILQELVLVAFLLLMACGGGERTIVGEWVFDKEQSTDLVTWIYQTPQLVIRTDTDRVTVLHQWLSRATVVFTDSFSLHPGGKVTEIPVHSARWSENWYMGVLSKPGTTNKVSGAWIRQDRLLQTKTMQTVATSQGETEIETERTYGVDWRGRELTVTEKRSSRPTEIKMVFKRADQE